MGTSRRRPFFVCSKTITPREKSTRCRSTSASGARRDVGGRRAPRRRGPPTPIKEAVVTVQLVPSPQSADAAWTPSENVGGLQPSELSTERSQDDLLDFHGALHGADA